MNTIETLKRHPHRDKKHPSGPIELINKVVGEGRRYREKYCKTKERGGRLFLENF